MELTSFLRLPNSITKTTEFLEQPQLLLHLLFYKGLIYKLSWQMDFEQTLMIRNAGTRKLIHTTEQSTNMPQVKVITVSLATQKHGPKRILK